MAERRYIAEFGVSERVEGPFAISNAQMGRTRNDKSYLRCLLSDKSGEVSGRMWSIEEGQFRRLPTDGFVWVEGETQAYQGDMQLIIHSIDPIEPTPEQMCELLPSTDKDVGAMFEEVKGLLGTLKHPAAKALANEYLADEFLMDQFRRAPAAKNMHHAYLGGLLEHTLQLLKLADAVCPFYPKMNRDVVMLGLFLHDLGKTRELRFDQTFNYSDRGELIGHIVEGAIMLHDKAQQVMKSQGVRLPSGMLTILQHIILSHHGIPEYGAAKIPSTPEAVLVAILDNLDAKTTIAMECARPTRAKAVDLGGNFTDKHWALGTKMFRPDVLGDGV
jgi:3'-5' exoribonuclease